MLRLLQKSCGHRPGPEICMSLSSNPAFHVSVCLAAQLRLGYHPSLIRCCWAQTASHNQVQENLQNYLSGNSLRHEISFFVHNESCYYDNINMIDEILKYNLFLESLCFITIFENIVSFLFKTFFVQKEFPRAHLYAPACIPPAS